VVQDWLGHSSITVTLDVYIHLTEGLHGDAANLAGGLIAGTSVAVGWQTRVAMTVNSCLTCGL